MTTRTRIIRSTMLRSPLIRGALLLTLVFAGACEIPFRHRQRHPYPVKAVTAKEGVSVLVAGNARCLVPTKVFPKVKVGDRYECNWHESGPAVPPGE